MFPEGAANQSPPIASAPGQVPQQQAAPPIQQQFQPPPQAQQPVQQQYVPPAPMPVIPSPQNLQRQPQAPVQQQQQPAAPNYDNIYNSVAAALGTTPDIVRQELGQDIGLGIASLVRDAAGVLRNRRNEQTQVQPVAQQQQQASTDGKIPLADGWQNVVQKNAQGVYEPVHPQYKQYADAANHNALVDRQRFERYQQDPTLLMQHPDIQKAIQKQINDTVQSQVREQQIMALRDEYRGKFAKEITQVDERGVTKMGLDGKPIMTPLGMALAKHVNALAESGMQESRQLYETAMIMARNEIGVQGFAANVQHQQQPNLMQPPQNMQGQPYYPQQGQPQYAQPQTANLASMLQQNAQAYYPGQAPARGPVMQPSIEGSLYEMVKDMPDGLTAGQYLESIGSLFAGSGARR